MHIVSAEEMYEIDKWTTESFGLDEKILMENAGRAAAAKVAERVSKEQKIVVLAGGGNNGGDGFVIARTLLLSGHQVSVLQAVADEKVTGTPAYHKTLYLNAEGDLDLFDRQGEAREKLDGADVIIDCLLGIGVKGQLKSPYSEIVEWINQLPAITISIDIPSGIPAGEAAGEFSGVQADFTVIIEAPKPSALVQATAPYYGKWEVVSIGIPHSIVNRESNCSIWQEANIRNSLPEREAFSHKGSHGRGLVIGGAREMPGSVTLSTSAALRSGAGLVTAAVPKEVIPVLSAHVKEATYEILESENGRISNSAPIDTSGYDALAIGMGMGREAAAGSFTRRIVADAEIPVLIDADGLYHIKEDMEILKKADQPVILTPHPGEMAMLAGLSAKEILASPFRISKEFAMENNVYLVLKGAFTIVTTPDGKQYANTTGNAGLAKGGSGDALSGILLAMVMKKQSIQEALSNGCFLHGRAAELLTKEQHSQEDMLASDLIAGLGAAFHSLNH